MKIELALCTEVIIADVENGRDEEHIANTYAMALVSSWPTDWRKVNTAIAHRFGHPGLELIKERAWAIVEEKTKAST